MVYANPIEYPDLCFIAQAAFPGDNSVFSFGKSYGFSLEKLVVPLSGVMAVAQQIQLRDSVGFSPSFLHIESVPDIQFLFM